LVLEEILNFHHKKKFEHAKLSFNFFGMEKFFGRDSEDTRSKTREKHAKFLVLGDTRVGKTTLFDKYANIKLSRTKDPKIKQTIGATSHIKKITSTNPASTLITEFIDFGGDSEYIKELPVFLRILLSDFTRNGPNYSTDLSLPIDGVFIVFDINNKSSFYSTVDWTKWLFDNLV
jgi:GTPase SAR1 family protein